MTAQPFKLLLQRVARREMWRRAGAGLGRGCLLAAAVTAGLMLIQRGLGLFSPWDGWIWLAIVAVITLGVAALGLKAPSLAESARLADRRTNAADLFLSALNTEAAGRDDFTPVVVQSANDLSRRWQARQLVAWAIPVKSLGLAALFMAMVLAGSMLPQFDPFGRQQQQVKLQEKKRELEQLAKKTREKAVVIRAQANENAKQPVATALEELRKTLAEAKPPENAKDLKKLNDAQKDLGAKWQKLNQEKLADSLPKSAGQDFGGKNELSENLRKAVAEKDMKAIQKAVEDVQQKMAEAENASKEGGQKAADKQREARNALRELNEALAQSLGSESLEETMSRARQQQDKAAQEDLAQEGGQGARESLDLAKEQIEQMLEDMKNQQNLEDALQAAQQAKRLAQQGKLDGSQAEGAESMQDYAKKYQEAMDQLAAAQAKQGQGQGEGQGQGQGNGSGLDSGQQGGMGGRGIGQGGKAAEDNSIATSFTPERSPAMLQAGKTLMEWSQKGQGDKNAPAGANDNALQSVREGVGEAMVKEQVPGVYRESIQKYFDSLKNGE